MVDQKSKQTNKEISVGSRAIYRPQNVEVSVGRRLVDPESKQVYVTVQEIPNGDPNQYRRSYQASPSELQPTGLPYTGPTPLPVPFAPGSAPEKPRVARQVEVTPNVDPEKLIWVNDPDILPEYIKAHVTGIGMKSATQIIEVRDNEFGGEYKALEEIPLPVSSLKNCFTLVKVNTDPEKG